MALVKENVDFKHNLKVYFGILSKYKAIFTVLTILLFLTEFTYIADKYIFKIIIDNATKFSNNQITFDVLTNILIIIIIAFFSIIILRAIGKWLNLHITNILETNMIADVKRKFFNHIIHLSHGFHTSHKTGSLISRLIRGGSAVESLTDIWIFQIVPLMSQLIFVAGSLFIMTDVSTSIVLLIVVISFVSYSVFVNKLQQKAIIIANKTEDIEKGNISDIFTNIDSIKYFAKESMIKKRFFDLSNNTRATLLKAWEYYRWLDAGQILISGIGLFFLLYFPMLKFLDGKMTIGTLVFIYSIYGNIIGNLHGFIRGIRDFYKAMANCDDLFQYGKISNDIKDKPNAKDLEVKKGTIEFKNITFNYKNKTILDNFSLKVPENKKIALVGPSGAGKTTIIKLLYRLYDPNEGNILIDNKDIKDLTQQSVRSELSIVPQECILFDDTIYNNILFSRPDATKKQVFAAIKFAQLGEFVNSLQLKEKTIVGERGVKLSGGEKQRVSIARAILANKKILVLDEATSSLDSQLEHEIQKELAELMKGRTSLIIAHRLSTIMSADVIVVLNKGKIVQKGTHEELIKQEGIYKKLWTLQKGGYMN